MFLPKTPPLFQHLPLTAAKRHGMVRVVEVPHQEDEMQHSKECEPITKGRSPCECVELAYIETLDGSYPVTGDVSELGWFAVRYDSVTILTVDGQGFVDSLEYDDEDSADRDWESLEADTDFSDSVF